ncbi:YidC/Oxa1 family membrane protein insertase [Ruminococcus sp.]|uniref:YidC/Oxa1 family membrane protein insertase n=1 Tax=Ruminococcus sp. TaxID=41978 RepID=UPI00262B8513|nr:YidC/Oxa1 family membrane protein insertase [Ruminococcus sp.]MDD6988059.1 YidC/Oxa1 family membrane protein insertase [Ruminococcus sp.]MDY6202062.1 YidC/Oxa1 family membrane protein insertase [Ruminococcus sp.]
MQIFGFLGSLLGYILWGAFYILKDFGLSIIVFTLIVKLILFPFSVKQQKSMAGTARLSKKQKELQEKYGNNREKYSEELNKLYEKEGVKPMGGCLTTIIPLIVILGIFYAVAYPLTNTLHLNSEDVNNALSYINTIPGYSASVNPTYQEISLLKIFPNIMNTEAVQGIFNAQEISTIQMFTAGFNTFGVDLLAIPKDYGIFSWYIMFPVLCFASNIGSQLVMTMINKNQMAQQQGCMKVMLFVLPLFSAYIAYTVPAAVAFYWIISAVISLIQSIVLSKIFSPAQLTANSEARHVAAMLENEAKIPYVYAPHELKSGDGANSKKKKKK